MVVKKVAVINCLDRGSAFAEKKSKGGAACSGEAALRGGAGEGHFQYGQAGSISLVSLGI